MSDDVFRLDYERGSDIVFMDASAFDDFLAWLRSHGLDVENAQQCKRGIKPKSKRAIIQERQREHDQRLADSEFDLGARA